MQIPWTWLLHYLLCGLLSVGAWAQSPPPCVLEGSVRDSVTGAPLAKASVRLTTAKGQGGYLGTSDASGKFRFDAVKPADYDVEVERHGYSDGPPIRLHLIAGDIVKDFRLEVDPLGVISGTVRDPDGEPVAKAEIRILVPGWRVGQRAFDEASGETANERGEFRIAAPEPGRYLVEALPGSAPGFRRAGVRDAPDRAAWHLGISTAEIEIRAGQEVSGIELKLPKEPCFRIKGTTDPNVKGRAFWFGSPRGVRAERVNGRGFVWGLVRADGKFELDGIPPGDYLVYEVQFDQPLTSALRVSVTSRDVEGIALRAANVSLTVRLRFENETAPPIASLHMSLKRIAPAFQVRNLELVPKPDGTVVVADLVAGHYSLQLWPRAEAYVKSTSYAGQPVTSRELELAGGSNEVELVLSTGTGTVDGGADLPSGSARPLGLTAVLAPMDVRAGHPAVFSAPADQTGAFSFEFVPPGQYRAFLVNGFDSDLWWNREFCRQVEGLGASVDVPEKGRVRVQAPILDEAAIQHAIAGIGQ